MRENIKKNTESLKKNGYITEKKIKNEDRCILTEKKLFLANEVFEEFI